MTKVISINIIQRQMSFVNDFYDNCIKMNTKKNTGKNKMINNEKIKNNLLESIKESGITQNDLAKKLEISQTAISKYFSRGSLPSLEIFANLCDILDLDANEILCLHNYGIERYGKPVIQQAEPLDKHEQELFNIFKQLSRDNQMRYLGYGDMLLRSQTSD